MPTSTPPSESPVGRWSPGGIAWVVGFSLLAALTVCFLFNPDWFVSLIGDVHPVFLAIPWAIIVVLWAVWYQDRRRALALAAFCKERGWQYEASLSHTQWEMQLFETGEQRYAHNGMTGKLGEHDIVVLDYHFSLSQGLTGRSTTTVVFYQTVVVFPRAGTGLPTFQLLARERLWTKPGITTPKDLAEDLEIGKDNRAFAARYKVSGKSAGRIRGLFTPEICNYLAEHPGWDVESDANDVIIYQERVRQSPRKLEAFLENAAAILRVLNNAE